MDRFQRLDSSLNGSDDGGSDAGGNIAMRIGERLEELERQRKRAMDAKFLIECWQEVSERGELNILEDHRRSGGIVRCADIARQLLRISARLDPESTQRAGVNGNADTNANSNRKTMMQPRHNTKEVIEKFLENLEQDLLSKFDECYKRLNYDGMRDCAVALRGFSDGSSVIATYISQHSFFIDRHQLVSEELSSDPETWEQLQDPDAEPPVVESTLQSLIDEVRIVLQEESSIIKRAFPFY